MNNAALSKKFGKVIRKLREDRGISQEGLALIADIDRSFMGKLERGVRQPSLFKISQLAKALGVSASSIIKKLE